MAKRKRGDNKIIWARAISSIIIATGIALFGVVWTNPSSQGLFGIYNAIMATAFVIGSIILAQYRLGEIEATDKAEEQEAQLEALREITKEAIKEGVLEALREFKAEGKLTNEQIQHLMDEQPEETEDGNPPEEKKRNISKKDPE